MILPKPSLKTFLVSRQSEKKSIWYLLLLIGLVSGCQPSSTSEETASRPNFVIIMADDLGYGDIGSYGHPDYQTPNLDSLAKSGLRFTDFHSNGAVCTPTRAALLTGSYQQRSGMEGVIYVRGETRETGLNTEQVTFAELLKQAGYATGMVGKWHLGYRPEYNPVQQGFDFFRGYVSGNIDYHSHYDNAGIYDWWHELDSVQEEGYVTDLLTRHANAFLEDHQQEPFCLYIAHEAPHWPYQGRNDPADRFPDTDFPAFGSREDRRGAYREMVEVMDESVGSVLSTLQRLNLSDNTLVFFCSDNGGVDSLGNNGSLRGHKTQLWEGGHRVPAIAYWPGTITPAETNATVLSMDILPTLLSLADITPPENYNLDGVDISALLTKSVQLEERATFWRYRGQSVARQGDWKLLVQQDSVYLFNLTDDVNEQHNVAANFPERVQMLQDTLSGWENAMNQIPQQTE